MIGRLHIRVNAAQPNLPLPPLYSFVGAPSAILVCGVPHAVGSWQITSVAICASYPDNTIASVQCVRDADGWVGTLPASTEPGSAMGGFAVTASGVDERGAAVEGYVLGTGDVIILNRDSTITTGETTWYLHLVDTVPAKPKKGDTALIDGAWAIYTGSAWSPLAGTIGWDDIGDKPTAFPPTKHAATHAADGDDALTPADIGAVAATSGGQALLLSGDSVVTYDPSKRFHSLAFISPAGLVIVDVSAVDEFEMWLGPVPSGYTIAFDFGQSVEQVFAYAGSGYAGASAQYSRQFLAVDPTSPANEMAVVRGRTIGSRWKWLIDKAEGQY